LRYVLRAPARDTENEIGLEKTNFQEKRMTKKQKGFSLIELLIVVAIILIIAAIAIPNLLRSRMAANEASAVGSIRTINTSAVTFYTTYGDGYPPSLSVQGGTGAVTCQNAELLDTILGQDPATKSGYTFTWGHGATVVVAANVPAGCTAGYIDGYTISAWATNQGTTGNRSFCSDATGVIRYDPTGTHPAVAGGLCPTALSPLGN
jgi:prepilin-type N-terminal cleavage/methylation domain-containing protein